MKLKSLSKFIIISFIFTISSFCFGGVFAHAEAESHGYGHEQHEHLHITDTEVHFAESKKACCEHEQEGVSEMNLSMNASKIIPFLYFFIVSGQIDIKNNLIDYIHTSSLSPPPEMVALSSVVKRE